jgi:hypothetical protein
MSPTTTLSRLPVRLVLAPAEHLDLHPATLIADLGPQRATQPPLPGV